MMKNRKKFKKRQHHFRKEEEPVRIKEKRKRPKKINKQNIYRMLEESDNYLGLTG